MLKTVTREVIKFTPSSEKVILERDKKYKATVVCFKPLSKREFDSYTKSLGDFKRNKFISYLDQASKILFERCLTVDEKGVFIYNAAIDGKEVEQIIDKDQAVKFLLDLGDIDSANEIEAVMRGQSALEEDEEKN